MEWIRNHWEKLFWTWFWNLELNCNFLIDLPPSWWQGGWSLDGCWNTQSRLTDCWIVPKCGRVSIYITCEGRKKEERVVFSAMVGYSDRRLQQVGTVQQSAERLSLAGVCSAFSRDGDGAQHQFLPDRAPLLTSDGQKKEEQREKYVQARSGPSLADSEGPEGTLARFAKFMARAIYCCIEFACAGQLNRFKVKITDSWLLIMDLGLSLAFANWNLLFSTA